MRSLARRPIVLAALVAVTALVTAALAFGQDLVPIKITSVTKVTPNKAGTPKHPQGINIDVKSTIDTPRDYDPPLAQTVDVWISKGGNYNGAKYPTCSPQAMDRKGIGACPKKSIMGHGTGKADADGVASIPDITVVNGGAHAVHFYTVLQHPARVQKTVSASITKLNSGPWGYKAHATIPRSLQIVAGIPLRVESLHVNAGYKSYAKDWVATTMCPASHKWKYHVEVSYETGQVAKFDGAVTCRS
ncbi:MAG TPA: hypothetical protein VFY45_11700 [Baekduia sp.]|nr:hypothetical protein [Baekduia sp.]